MTDHEERRQGRPGQPRRPWPRGDVPDPDGHVLEIITRPYGGWAARVGTEGEQESMVDRIGIPGATLEVDAGTFLGHDLPALLALQFGLDDARQVACAVLHVGGTASGRWFAEVRELVLTWFPHAEDVRVSGAGHTLVPTHTAAVAEAVRGFLRRHPMSRG